MTFGATNTSASGMVLGTRAWERAADHAGVVARDASVVYASWDGASAVVREVGFDGSGERRLVEFAGNVVIAATNSRPTSWAARGRAVAIAAEWDEKPASFRVAADILVDGANHVAYFGQRERTRPAQALNA